MDSSWTVLSRVDAQPGLTADRIDAIQRNETNPFVTSPFRRFLAKLALFVHGYRFGEGEIMARLIPPDFSRQKMKKSTR